MADAAAVRLDRTDYRLEFEDDFDGQSLNPTRWLPCYLPQWRLARGVGGALRPRRQPAAAADRPGSASVVSRVGRRRARVVAADGCLRGAGWQPRRTAPLRTRPGGAGGWMQPRSTRRGTASSNAEPGQSPTRRTWWRSGSSATKIDPSGRRRCWYSRSSAGREAGERRGRDGPPPVRRPIDHR